MKRYPLLAASAFVAVAVAALAAAGCGGGSGSVTPTGTTNTQSQSSKATMHITIPSRSSGTSTGKRGAQYISPSTESASFTIGSLAPQYADLSSTSSSCSGAQDSAGTATRTCTIQINAYVGDNQTLVIKTFSGAGGAGSVLTNNTENINVSADAGSNTENYVLSGVMDHFTVTLDPTSVTTGGASDVVASVTPYDAGNNVIIGTPVNADGSALDPSNLSLTANPSTGITIGAFDGDNGTFTAHYDGSATTSPVTFTLALTGYTSATATLTVSASPAPTESPTASPTASTAPTNAIVNGDFALGLNDGSDWYTCYGVRVGTTTSSLPINASPDPVNATAQGSTTTPAPTSTAATDTSVQTTTPSGAAPPSGKAQFALVGYSGGTGLPAPAANKPGKGNTGICQNIASVPAGAMLTFNVYEGGDDDWQKSDDEADVYPAGAFVVTTGSPVAAAAPTERLYAQNNCYDSAGWEAIFLNAPFGTGTVNSSSTTARWSGCPATPGGTTPSGTTSLGGYWYAKSLDMSAYAGQSITLFLGIGRDAGASIPTSSGAQYYNYAFFDNVALTGTGPCSAGKRGAQSTSGKRTPRC